LPTRICQRGIGLVATVSMRRSRRSPARLEVDRKMVSIESRKATALSE
jgi:hypothetical protein